MSAKHPIISVTGSSGAGTTTIRQVFAKIFRRENVRTNFVDGDAFHRYDRESMKRAMADAAEHGNMNFSHFGPEANLFRELETVFRTYGETGRARLRHYIHDDEEAKLFGVRPGQFTPWENVEEPSDVMFYEGLHGALVTDDVNIARYADLKIGVVPVINLEWIQKIHRDQTARGYTPEAVTDTILRRMPDYVNYICPQFAHTDINFQRVPTVDTSNPFISRWVPPLEESIVVIRFANPVGIDFPYLLSMIEGSSMSRANTIVVPGGKLDLSMQLIFTPMILRLVEISRRYRPQSTVA